MIKVRDEKDQVTIAKVYRANQEHVFRFWEDLDDGQRRGLLDQLDQIDFQLLVQLTRKIGETRPARKLAPPPEVLRAPRTAAEEDRDARAHKAGEESLRAGQAAGIIVSGGQGTRLDFEGPKGCFPIGPVTDRSLFQIFAEQALAAARRYRSSFPLYIMTSEENHEAVTAFWRDNNHFGLSAADVYFFTQRELPVVDRRGRLLLIAPGRVATSPNGHGGLIESLRVGGALADMAKRGVELVSYWQVDNPLVPVADPTFLGDLLAYNADGAAKVSPKRDPGERVGVWGLLDGQLGVVEYTELSDADATSTTEDGRLRFGSGNLAIHAFRREFLDRLATSEDALPYHVAHKKVPHLDRDGARINPSEPNVFKFECFIFDAFRHANGVVLREVDRRAEFSPVKNRSGQDSPESCRRALNDLYGGWLEEAGAKLERGNGGAVLARIEISPLVAQSAAELERKIEPGTAITGDFQL